MQEIRVKAKLDPAIYYDDDGEKEVKPWISIELGNLDEMNFSWTAAELREVKIEYTSTPLNVDVEHDRLLVLTFNGEGQFIIIKLWLDAARKLFKALKSINEMLEEEYAQA